MNFPTIPNVKFKLLQNVRSGRRVYAASSDGRIWIGGRSWNVVTPYKFCDGEMAVMLQVRTGARMYKVAELVKAAFRDDTNEPHNAGSQTST